MPSARYLLVCLTIILLASTQAVAATNFCSERYIERYAKKVSTAQTKCSLADDRTNRAVDQQDEAIRLIVLQISTLIVDRNPNSLGCKILGVFNSRCNARKQEKKLHLRRASLIKKWERKVQRAQDKAEKLCTSYSDQKISFDQLVAKCQVADSPASRSPSSGRTPTQTPITQ